MLNPKKWYIHKLNYKVQETKRKNTTVPQALHTYEHTPPRDHGWTRPASRSTINFLNIILRKWPQLFSYLSGSFINNVYAGRPVTGTAYGALPTRKTIQLGLGVRTCHIYHGAIPVASFEVIINNAPFISRHLRKHLERISKLNTGRNYKGRIFKIMYTSRQSH